MTYQEFAKTVFKKEFPMPFFENYFTGGRVPSWEDNDNHKRGIQLLDTSVAAARQVGQEPMEFVDPLEPRFAFDHAGLTRATWHGFSYMNHDEIKFASNGDFGNIVIDELLKNFDTTDTLGVLMTDSFSQHISRLMEANTILTCHPLKSMLPLMATLLLVAKRRLFMTNPLQEKGGCEL
jgi:hypothetical protein